MSWQILQGDAREVLAGLEAESVHCCVTSPPYYGLRDYGVEGQIGLEETPEAFVAELVGVLREVRRVMRDDGTLWLNLGDSYNAYNGGAGPASGIDKPDGPRTTQRPKLERGHGLSVKSLKPKDLLGIPWMVAFALRADGWYLRSEVIWSKPNPMPESVTDRPTKSHEQLFLLAKSPTYFYDAEAIRERESLNPISFARRRRTDNGATGAKDLHGTALGQSGNGTRESTGTRNRRTVWEIATEPYPDAHFATYPTALVKPCILAGTSAAGVCAACGAPRRRVVERETRPNRSANNGKHNGAIDRTVSGGVWNDRRQSTDLGWGPTCDCAAPAIPATVLDPFTGSGTTGAVAVSLGRAFVGIELNPAYCDFARRRILNANPALPLFAE